MWCCEAGHQWEEGLRRGTELKRQNAVMVFFLSKFKVPSCHECNMSIMTFCSPIGPNWSSAIIWIAYSNLCWRSFYQQRTEDRQQNQALASCVLSTSEIFWIRQIQHCFSTSGSFPHFSPLVLKLEVTFQSGKPGESSTSAYNRLL